MQILVYHDLMNILERIKNLFKIGKRRILFETGFIFLNQLLSMKLINNLYIFNDCYCIKLEYLM